jgi:hypothetical protein
LVESLWRLASNLNLGKILVAANDLPATLTWGSEMWASLGVMDCRVVVPGLAVHPSIEAFAKGLHSGIQHVLLFCFAQESVDRVADFVLGHDTTSCMYCMHQGQGPLLNPTLRPIHESNNVVREHLNFTSLV